MQVRLGLNGLRVDQHMAYYVFVKSGAQVIIHATCT